MSDIPHRPAQPGFPKRANIQVGDEVILCQRVSIFLSNLV
jgi:hypothetical protein